MARLRWRRLWRSRLVSWCMVLATVFWFGVGPGDSLRPRLVVLMLTGLLCVAILGAGAVADSLDEGTWITARLHGLTPLAHALGETIGTLLALVPSMVIVTALCFKGGRSGELAAAVVAILWISVLLLDWAALLSLLGGFARGKGNAVVLVPLLLFSGIPPDDLPVGGLPDAIASAVRAAWTLLPLQHHAVAIADGVLRGIAAPRSSPVVLLAASPFFLALAAVRLRRLEPAGRFIR